MIINAKEQIGNKEVIIVTVFIIMFIVSGFLLLSYLKYEIEVDDCCYGYRKYVLNNQVGGECQYWTFLEHLLGIRGCVIEDFTKEVKNK